MVASCCGLIGDYIKHRAVTQRWVDAHVAGSARNQYTDEACFLSARTDGVADDPQKFIGRAGRIHADSCTGEFEAREVGVCIVELAVDAFERLKNAVAAVGQMVVDRNAHECWIGGDAADEAGVHRIQHVRKPAARGGQSIHPFVIFQTLSFSNHWKNIR